MFSLTSRRQATATDGAERRDAAGGIGAVLPDIRTLVTAGISISHVPKNSVLFHPPTSSAITHPPPPTTWAMPRRKFHRLACPDHCLSGLKTAKSSPNTSATKIPCPPPPPFSQRGSGGQFGRGCGSVPLGFTTRYHRGVCGRPARGAAGAVPGVAVDSAPAGAVPGVAVDSAPAAGRGRLGEGRGVEGGERGAVGWGIVAGGCVRSLLELGLIRGLWKVLYVAFGFLFGVGWVVDLCVFDFGWEGRGGLYMRTGGEGGGDGAVNRGLRGARGVNYCGEWSGVSCMAATAPVYNEATKSGNVIVYVYSLAILPNMYSLLNNLLHILVSLAQFNIYMYEYHCTLK